MAKMKPEMEKLHEMFKSQENLTDAKYATDEIYRKYGTDKHSKRLIKDFDEYQKQFINSLEKHRNQQLANFILKAAHLCANKSFREKSIDTIEEIDHAIDNLFKKVSSNEKESADKCLNACLFELTKYSCEEFKNKQKETDKAVLWGYISKPK